MKYSKIKDVLSPIRGTQLSAGIDFFVPVFNENFINDLILKNNFNDNQINAIRSNKVIKLLPNEKILIPSGIKVNFDGDPKSFIAFNKSGVASKKGLVTLACVIDQDYQGEIHISLANISNDICSIKENEKITQFIMIPIIYEDIIEVNDVSILYNGITDREDRGFGHTDLK